eukprot:1206327-Prymnesium_polylepis.1
MEVAGVPHGVSGAIDCATRADGRSGRCPSRPARRSTNDRSAKTKWRCGGLGEASRGREGLAPAT